MEWSYSKNDVKHFEAVELTANKAEEFRILASSYVVIPPISILTR